MIRQKTIGISILIFISINSFSQSILDSNFYILDSNILDYRIDDLGQHWSIYDKMFIVNREQNQRRDTFILSSNTSNLSIDISIPLKVLIYNKSRNSIEIYNSRWGLVSNFKLDQIEIYQPSLVKYANDKTILVLNRSDNKLYKTNENGVVRQVSLNPFKIQNQYYFPSQLIELNNSYLALDTSVGLFLIDDYGSLVHSWLDSNLKSIYSIHGKIYAIANHQIFQYKLNTSGIQSKQKAIELPFSPIGILNTQNRIMIRDSKNRVFEWNIKEFESYFK